MTAYSNSKKDKNTVGLAIEKMVKEQPLTYLEATTQFLEENHIDVSEMRNYVNQTIIDKIIMESIDERLLRPSVCKLNKRNNLEDLF